MYGKCCLSLFLLSTFTSAYGDVPQCDLKIPLIDNFDDSKIEGLWYVIKFGDEEKSRKKCMTATIEKGEGTLELKEVGFVDGQAHHLDVTLTPTDSASAYLAESAEFSSSPASVVGTDYASFLTWFLCRNGHQQEAIIIATTREKSPSAETMKKVHDSFEKAGIDISSHQVYPIDHSSC